MATQLSRLFQLRIAFFVGALLLLFWFINCGLIPTPFPLPEPSSASFDGVNIMAPGATIVAAGSTYDGNTGLAADGLVGIIKDGNTYLYHSSLGSVELSEETSRRAVGAFFLENSTTSPASKSVLLGLQSLAIGSYQTLSTGTIIRRIDTNTYEAINEQRRWIAIKRGDTDPPVFVQPRSTYATTSIYDWSQVISADWHLEERVTFDVGDIQTLEVYCAVSRATMFPASLPFVVDKARIALDHDSQLFIRVNAVDFGQVLIDGIGKLSGLGPAGDCYKELGEQAALRAFETFFVRVLGGDEQIAQDMAEAIVADSMQSLVQCACSFTVACEVVNKFLAIVEAGFFVADEAVHGNIDILTNDAYAALPHTNLQPPTAPNPTISPNGGTFSGSVQITLACSDASATIRYTIDGGTPSSTSPLYSSPFALTNSATVKARAFKSGYNDSGVASASFTINATPTVPTPTISPNGGTYTGSVQVTLACSDASATIRYTTNGTNPTSSSTPYAGPFTLTSSATVKAKGFRSGYNDSGVASASFTINATPTVPTPTISPNGGTYTGSVQVTLACSDASATIRYTTNGTNPTSSSTPYAGPFTLTSSATVKAKGFRSGYNDSAVASASFTVVVPAPDLVSVVGIPSSVQVGQAFTVTVTARNNGGASPEGGINASVLYSDGSDNMSMTGPTGSGFDQLINRQAGYYPIYNSSCNPITAQDRLIEAVDANWTNAEEHSMSFTVTPQQAGTLWVRVRTNMAADVSSCNYINDTSVSDGVSDTDQQGWTVRRFAVTVGPIPDLVSVTGIPSSVQVGQAFTVTVTARNNGGASPEGGINASVLYSDGCSDQFDVSGPTGSGFDQLLNRQSGYYPIYDSGCNPITAQNRLIEAVDANWTNGEEHSMSFTVTPQQAGTLWVRVRMTMAANVPSCIYINDTSVSAGASDTDQQGWTVRRFAVSVLSASSCCAGSCSCPFGATPISNPTTSWQTKAGSITAGGWSSWAVTLVAGQTYTFKTGCGNGATASFDSVIEVYNFANCSLVACNDDSTQGGATSSKVTFTAVTTNDYHVIKVRSYYSTESGNYTLAYRRN